MVSKILAGTIVVAWALSAPTSASAEAVETAVTFNVPVDLTQLSSDIERVRVYCGLTSAALTLPLGFTSAENIPRDERLVVLGKVKATFQVVFPIGAGWLQNATGKTANYECGLMGYSTSLKRWGYFADDPTALTFRVSPTPQALTGTFTWE